MEARSSFNYTLFRQQAVDKLRTGGHQLSSLYELLDPIIQDILATLLVQSKSREKETDGTGVPTQVAEKKADQPRKTRSPTSPPARRPESYQEARQTSIYREVLAWYEQGSSYQNIQGQLHFSHRTRLDLDELTQITDYFLPEMEAWRKRPLRPLYACLWITNTMSHLWQVGSLVCMTVYSILAVDLQGNQDILGHYVDDRDTNQIWADLLADLQSRGVKDLLMVCVDEPTRLTTLIHQIYPQTQVHGCLTQHLQRTLHSIKGTDSTKLKKELKGVYQATDREEMRVNWQNFKASWQSRYPLLVDSWERNWDNLLGPLHYPDRVRRLIQSIPALTDLQSQLLKLSSLNGSSATETELLKSLYIYNRKRFSKAKAMTSNWGLIIQQLGGLFGERVSL